MKQVPKIKYILEQIADKSFEEMLKNLVPLDDIVDEIDSAIVEEPPISVTDGGVIKDGYDQQLDQYRDATNNGQKWLAELEAKERKVTGINNLKVGFNHVFGYYIEVTKVNLDKIPANRYQRKQTLANAERFSTPELKEKEALILEAQEQSKTWSISCLLRSVTILKNPSNGFRTWLIQLPQLMFFKVLRQSAKNIDLSGQR